MGNLKLIQLQQIWENSPAVLIHKGRIEQHSGRPFFVYHSPKTILPRP